MSIRENISCPHCHSDNVTLIKKPTGRIKKHNNSFFIVTYIVNILVFLFALVLLLGSMDTFDLPTFEQERRTAYQIMIYDTFVFFVLFFVQILRPDNVEYEVLIMCRDCKTTFNYERKAETAENVPVDEADSSITIDSENENGHNVSGAT